MYLHIVEGCERFEKTISFHFRDLFSSKSGPHIYGSKRSFAMHIIMIADEKLKLVLFAL